MKKAISNMASERDKKRFFIKYLVPFKNNNDFPVNKTLYLSEGKSLLRFV